MKARGRRASPANPLFHTECLAAPGEQRQVTAGVNPASSSTSSYELTARGRRAFPANL